MKKLVPLFLSVVTILFSGYNYASAGGVDKEETLSDGTKLIYVSTERIPEILNYYEQKKKELLDKRWSTYQSLAVKGVAVAAGAAGWWLFSKLGDSHATAELCGKAVSAIAGLVAFFYPNYVDYILGREYCEWDDRENYQCWLTNYGPQWGPDASRHEGYGVATICSELGKWYRERTDHDGFHVKYGHDDEIRELESGTVIILRPKSKWNKFSNTAFNSGIFAQCEMEHGVLRGLHNSIARGE
jgi:hypothetical protein